ncbi:MAG: choice-of-anchor Q domain-containing protein [Chthoniobacterales bacterium]
MRNTIIVGTPSDPHPDVTGTFISEGYNFIGDATTSTGFGTSGSHDQIGNQTVKADAKLGPLDDYGGSTLTMAPLVGSPVIDQGDSGGVATDQRGFARRSDNPAIGNVGDGSDIGAVETGAPQSGPNFMVTNIGEHDDGSCTNDDCTLREAIKAANGNADANTIFFAPGVTGAISLTSALPNIVAPVVIRGPGANLLRVQRNTTSGNFRIFAVVGNFSATISGLTVSDGNLPGGNGGGIYNNATLTLTNDTISGNVANAAGNGGGVYNAGSLTVNNCTLSGNSVSSSSGAGSGGAIFNFGGTLNITNSTISGNTANCASTTNDSGGGIFSNVGNVTLTSTTIAGNSGDLGGGIRVANGAVIHVRNTIIALNTTVNGQPGADVNGDFISDGHNFIGKAQTGFASTGFTDGVNGDQVGTGTASAPPKNPMLDPLKNNGGPTATMALLSNSTAINAGDDGKAPATDQRGYYRNGVSDVGAFEFNGAAPVPPTVTTGVGTNITSTTATLNATVNPNGLSTTVQFTTDFGTFAAQSIGSGSGAVPVTLNVTGLSPATTYHFNATATNAAGTMSGVQQAFTTPPGPSPSPTSTPTPTATPNPTATPTPAPSPTPALLGNIATRLRVETGDNALIGGFIVTGTQPKRVIIRAIGPSIDVAGRLENPTLELHLPDGSVVANDNWVDAPNAQEIAGTGIAPTNTLDSAILTTLAGGNSLYTAVVRGVNGGTGVGVIEAYDLSQQANSQLANISSRGLVQTGDNVMIGGFFILNGSRKVIVRAIGPSLPFAGTLADPTLELHDQNGGTTFNDNWRTGGQEAEILATSIPPSNDSESAIVATLAPGPYTAIVRGVNDTTGVAVVEVYALN